MRMLVRYDAAVDHFEQACESTEAVTFSGRPVSRPCEAYVRKDIRGT